MKTSELISELEAALKRHGDLEVAATWEGIETDISIYRGRVSQLQPEWKLLIDANEDFYRYLFEHPDDREANSPTAYDTLDNPAPGPASPRH